MPNKTSAVVPTALSKDDLMALLGQTGDVATSGGEYHRITLKAGSLETDDGDIFPPRRDGYAIIFRIVKPPVYYNAFFLGPEVDDRGNPTNAVDATRIGRADLNGRFSKKYDDPTEQAADKNEANEYYDEIADAVKRRGDFKADVLVQIVPDSGNLTGEETVYTLTLSTTSVFEWRGSSQNPSKGTVSETNFIVKLATFAAEAAAKEGADEAGQKQAILDAMTALRVGNVIAGVDILKAQNEKKTNTWNVLAWTPIHIEPAENGQPALGTGDDDSPF